MDDPIFQSTNVVGGNAARYTFSAMGREIHSNQSFVLIQTFKIPAGTAHDISSATSTLYVAAYKNSKLDRVPLTSGTLSDSGSGTTDTVTFIVPKDLIPTNLGSFPQRNGGNAVFFYILEDSNSVLEFGQGVNVIDPSYALTGDIDPGASTITTQRNDLGTVESTSIATPPAHVFGLAYVVAATGATGDWTGQEKKLAVSNGSAWLFTQPVQGNFVFNIAGGAQEVYNGTSWAVSAAGDMLSATYDPQSKAADAFARSSMTGTQAHTTISDFDTEISGTTNATAFTPTADYQPATKKYVDELPATLAAASHLINVANPHVVTPLQLGNDVAQWNANKLQGKELSSSMSSPSNGDAPIFNTSTQKWEPSAPGGGGGASGRPAFECNYNIDVTTSEPPTGGVKFDNVTPGSATIIRVSITDINNINITTQLSRIGSGDTFIVYQIDAPTKFLYFAVTSSNFVTTSYDISGSAISGGVAIDSGAACGVASYVNTSGGAAGVSSFKGRTGGVIPSGTDYNSTLIADASLYAGPTVEDSLNAIFNSVSPQSVAAGTDRNKTSVEYTITLSDRNNKTIWMNNALENKVKIPKNSSVAFDIGDKITIIQEGAGVTSIKGKTGVTLNGIVSNTIAINNKYQGVTLSKRAEDTWIATGDYT